MRPFSFLVGLLIAAACHDTTAAPYCAQYEWGKQCIYPDLNGCQTTAGADAECVVNEDEVKMLTGSEKYCVVSPYAATQCLYEEEEACREAARTSGGMCVMKID